MNLFCIYTKTTLFGIILIILSVYVRSAPFFASELFNPYFPEYDLYLMSELPPTSDQYKNTSIITPDGLFQLDETHTRFISLFTQDELTNNQFDEYRTRSSRTTKKSVQYELTAEQLCMLNLQLKMKKGYPVSLVNSQAFLITLVPHMCMRAELSIQQYAATQTLFEFLSTGVR